MNANPKICNSPKDIGTNYFPPQSTSSSSYKVNIMEYIVILVIIMLNSCMKFRVEKELF